MASTYSSLKIQLMSTGENSGTWGNVTNVNLGTAIEEAIVGSENVTFASSNVTLTLTDTNASQPARNLRLNLTGTTGGARDLIVPAIEKVYIINNGCADTVTVKNSTGTGIAVPAGKTMYVYNNGTNVVDAITHLTSLTLASPLPVASGGTGSNTGVNLQTAVSGVLPVANGGTGSATATFSGANISSLNASNISTGTLSVANGGTGATSLNSEAVVIGNSTSAVKFVAPGTTGNVLTSNGTAWISQAISAGGNYALQAFTGPGTWTKPAGLKAVKVTVVGGGGGGGSSRSQSGYEVGARGGGGGGGVAIEAIPAPSIPGPVSVTVGSGGGAATTGGTSSFGAFCSATGGGGAPSAFNTGGSAIPFGPGGAGGSGSGGNINITGQSGASAVPGYNNGGLGGGTFMGQGSNYRSIQNTPGTPGAGYGGGGSGAGSTSQNTDRTGGSGTGGIVFVEEFY